MLLSDLDARLGRFVAAVDVMTSNLVELESNPTNKLLDPASLGGITRERIAAARQTLASLWEHFTEFKGLVERARDLRGTSSHVPQLRLQELEALLTGPSITLPPIEVPLASRGLYTPAQTPVATTPEQLLADMGAAFEAAKREILGVDEAWRTLVPRLGAAQKSITELAALARSLGEPGLERDQAQVDALGQLVSNDPLGVDEENVTQLEASLSTARARLERLSQDHENLEQDLQACGQRLDEIAASIADGEAALAEARVKIADPTGLLASLDRACLTDARRGLTPWLERLKGLASQGEWRLACRGVREWSRVADDTLSAARSVVQANTAPVRERNELRGRLDAFAAKAERLGLTENSAVSSLRTKARDVLFTAPTDLALASSLVAEYGAALTDPTHRP